MADRGNFDARERSLSNYERYCLYRADGQAFQLPQGKKFVWWQPDLKEDTFESAEVVGDNVDVDSPELTIKTPSGDKSFQNGVQIFPRNPVKFDGVEDMAELPYLNEPSVLHNMRIRYTADLMHTYSGLFCVIVNPYKWIPIYTKEMVEHYQSKRRNEVAPHVYAVADGAYRGLLQDRLNQSILITGESGAGKTENTKKVIQYLATIAGRSHGEKEGTLEDQIIQANPCLESFGNAKTTRNNNSSRFGKFIEIQFNDGGYISGASVISYLLEKSRVVHQGETERNYHCFYQLTKAAPQEVKDMCKVTRPDDYNFLNKSGCIDVPQVDDKQEFEDNTHAMTIMKFSEVEQQGIWRIIGTILHLGNVVFEATRGEQCQVKDKKEMNTIAEVCQIKASDLEAGLIEPKILAGRDLVKTAFNKTKASASRDALAKALYGRLFAWIVKKINLVLSKEKKHAFIGVLDISGFEIFKYNSFEQLCINYTNEKLQQFFNHHMFKLEQEEYQREQINWTFIDFGMDSQATIDLIDAKAPPGILALLDEACFTQSTDAVFLSKVHNQFGKNHPKYEEPRFSKTAFGIEHYAGKVIYETEDWLEKNKDPLQNDLKTAFLNSELPFVSKLFSDKTLALDNDQGGGANAKRGRGAAFITVAGQHKDSLNDLMSTLQATYPHFIRCILPNHRQVAGEIEDKCVLEQLRCNGVLEGIRIARKGFPNRVIYADFVKRYYILNKDVPRNAADSKAATEAILKGLKIEEELFRFGLTKIFFRAGILAKIEEKREEKIGQIIINIQQACRAWHARRHWKKLREETVSIAILQANIRAWIELKGSIWWKLFAKARPMLKRRNFELEIKERDEQIAKLKEDLASEIEKRQGVESKLKTLNDKINALEDSIKAEADALSAMKDERDGLESSKQDMQLKFDDVAGDVENQRTKYQLLSDEKHRLEEKINETELELQNEQKAKFNLENEKKALEREIEDFKAKSEEDQDSINRLEKIKTNLEAEIEDFQDTLNGESKDKGTLERASKKLQEDINEVAAKLENEIEARTKLQDIKKELEEKLAKTEGELSAESQAKIAEEQRNQKLTKQQGELSEKLEEVEKVVSGLEKACKELEGKKKSLEEDIEDVENQKNTLEAKRKQLESDLDELKEKLESSTGEQKELYDLKLKQEAELDSLRKNLEELENQATKLANGNKSLEGELADLESNLNDETKRKEELEKAKKKTRRRFSFSSI
jgi:myosin heavy subunit